MIKVAMARTDEIFGTRTGTTQVYPFFDPGFIALWQPQQTKISG